MDVKEISDISSAQESLCHELFQLKNNLTTLVSDIQSTGLSPELSKLSNCVTVLHRNLEYFLNFTSRQLFRGIDERKNELLLLRIKYENLQREWDKQQEHLGRLQGDVYRLRNQLQTQSSFCASLGSIMGNLVWKASRLQPVIELLLTTVNDLNSSHIVKEFNDFQNKLSEFFCVTSGTLVSFMETYAKEIPDIKSDETQFILSMSGIVANVAAVPEGRQFIVTDENGKELIEQILRLMPCIPNVSGDPLRRILLMVLYNVSINQTGLLLIQDQKPLLIALAQMITGDKIPELRIMALRLLESITFEIPSPLVLNVILQHIPMTRLCSLSQACDAEMRQYANNIISNVQKAEEAFSQTNLIGPPQVPFAECNLLKSTCSE